MLCRRPANISRLILLEPTGYLDLIKLMSGAAIVASDSGGIQDDTTILVAACLTLRENTEISVTTTGGTNRPVHVTAADVLEKYNELKASGFDIRGRMPRL